MTQEQLAERVGIEVRTVSRIECGDQGSEFGTIEKIARALNVKAEKLFSSSTSVHETGELTQTEKVYLNEIRVAAANRGIDLSQFGKPVAPVRSTTAGARFDRNRNRTKDPMAPIRIAALAQAFSNLLDRASNGVDAGDIWSDLQRVHVKFLEEQTGNSHSATQSWVKSSGTAFEVFVKNKISNEGSGIRVFKPAELSDLQRSGQKIQNVDKLEGRSEDDLYLIRQNESDNLLFGVMQAKTSIRERMKEDVSHSLRMVRAGLWTIFVTIDPDDFLSKPKFRGLADGASPHGVVWHAVYKMSRLGQESSRVKQFENLANDAHKAACFVASKIMNARWLPS